eukprot:7391898-Prymnesium_polylepis.3
MHDQFRARRRLSRPHALRLQLQVEVGHHRAHGVGLRVHGEPVDALFLGHVRRRELGHDRGAHQLELVDDVFAVPAALERLELGDLGASHLRCPLRQERVEREVGGRRHRLRHDELVVARLVRRPDRRHDLTPEVGGQPRLGDRGHLRLELGRKACARLEDEWLRLRTRRLRRPRLTASLPFARLGRRGQRVRRAVLVDERRPDVVERLERVVGLLVPGPADDRALRRAVLALAPEARLAVEHAAAKPDDALGLVRVFLRVVAERRAVGLLGRLREHARLVAQVGKLARLDADPLALRRLKLVEVDEDAALIAVPIVADDLAAPPNADAVLGEQLAADREAHGERQEPQNAVCG